jgi:hypothetical protein
MATIPSSILVAAHDPKVASTVTLERVVSFYSDDLHPDEVQLAAEELSRRGVEDFEGHDDYDYVSAYL